MEKYVFSWYVTDGYTYGYTCHVPFECEDIEKFILDKIEELQKAEYGIDMFGFYIYKDEIDNLEHSFLPLDKWFTTYKTV